MQSHALFVLFFLFLSIITYSCKNADRIGENSQLQVGDMMQDNREDTWLSVQQKFRSERIKGIDFLASNRDSSWHLRIKSDNTLSFDSDVYSFLASGVESMQPQDLNAVIYGAEKQSERISVMVYLDSCSSNQSEPMPNGVSISVKDSSGRIVQFKGCGLYLNDPALHDIWAVKSFTGIESQKNLPGSAYFEFNMQTNRIYGNLSCGDITGYFTPMGSNLKIFGMDFSDNSCAANSAAVQLFNHLNFNTHNVLKQGLELKLISQGDTVTFSKVD